MRYLFFITVALLFKSITVEAAVDSLRYGNFGQVYVYKPSKVPDAFVLFVSGDGGWNKGVVNIGMHIVAQGAMVVGINIKHYEKNLKSSKLSCYYPAGDFESLSIYIQKKYKFSKYLKPVLMGYSSGATLVYGALVQAPVNTFKGAISMGFCPDIVSNKPLCRGSGLELHPITPGVSWYLEPYSNLKNPFIVINGVKDKVCNYKDTEAFVKKVPNGEMILLPDIAHGMSAKSNYMPHLLYAYKKVKESSISIPTDGPFVIIPAQKGGGQPVVLFISGDGGWTSFDDGIAKELVKKGVAVIGLDSQKYFWQERTPQETAKDIVKILDYYMTEWEKSTFVLVGYSFGADVVPFIMPILPENISKRLIKSIMISPDLSADFEIHISDLLHINPAKEGYDVVAGVKNLRNDSIVCIFGSDEDTKRVLAFEKVGAKIRILPGKHHFNDDYNALKNVILFSLPKRYYIPH